MNRKQAEEILLRYKEGTATEDEKAWVESWYVQFGDQGLRDQRLGDPMAEDQIEADRAESWARLEEAYLRSRRQSVKLWPQIAVAVAAVSAITLGVWLYYGSGVEESKNAGGVEYAKAIRPGKNTATLKLASGKVLNLDTNRSNVVIADSIKTMTMLVASTPRGGTYQVELSDGTLVWLNAASKITFPSQFNGKERKILLEGEAYFEVAKDKSRPFIVESKGQEIEVLGTHFNVNAYADEPATTTTLVEGSVGIRTGEAGAGSNSAARNRMAVLKPNQQARMAQGKLDVKEVDVQQSIAWKEGTFRFQEMELKEIMRQLGRWYNMDVSYEGEIPRRTFNGIINRNVNLSDILLVLQAGDVRFKIVPPEKDGGSRRIIVLQ